MRAPRWPLGVQLALSFLLVAALALGGGGTLLLRQMQTRQLEDRAASLLAQANAAANVVVAEQSAGRDLTLALARFQQSTGARPVLTDLTGAVQADVISPSPLAGRTLTQPELKAALAGQQQWGTRWLEGTGWVMYAAVPVYQSQQQVGAVLVSSDINAVDAALRGLGRQLALAAALAGALAVALGLGLARLLSAPLERLYAAVTALARGRLETRVEPGGAREVAELGAGFNRMAEELGRLDRQRRAFVADASHEMRTPVTAIRALAEGLLGDTSGNVERYREYLGDIVHESERAGRLVDRLLELARLDMRQEARSKAGSPAAEPEPADLRDAVAEVVQALRPLARERGVSLEYEPPSVALLLPVDLRLVETALGNLVENGIKYTPAGGTVRVTITAGSPVAIEVADTGPGIAAEHLPHIFERFYRVDKARARATGGAGLGLAIAVEAASLAGGRITVESELGKGSRFTLLLGL